MSEDQAEKIDRILRLCQDMANRQLEHDAELRFIRAQVDINTEDDRTLAARIRKLETRTADNVQAIEELTTALTLQRRSVHDLQAAEEKRRTSERAGGGE